ncbi:class I SAM-dependent methyltransferase [Aliigemmobacter aestuarii]|uniref:class I SAM-dependent methyltransferase n=1 Tax=Aliigemmobacter aestuarii TaxID=1445661 RepID=UPI001454E008|nr:class I SAM-dependent methyltransferase [Gemmobacter aestuarii]
MAGHLAAFHYSGFSPLSLTGESFRLCRCGDCGMTYHRRVLNAAGLLRLYGQWADAAQARRFEEAHRQAGPDETARDARRRLRLVLRLLAIAGSQRGRGAGVPGVLDYGAGAGGTMVAATALGCRVVGVEPSATRPQDATGRGAVIYPDLAALEQAGEPPFDAVVLDQVLEHLPDPLPVLHRIAALTRPGGALFLAVPDCRGSTVPQGFDQFHRVQPLEHLNAFTPDTLDRIARAAGFRPVRPPPAFLGTRLAEAIRAAGAVLWQPRTTDRFYRLDRT